jgi:CelD/BcsL family acetyltransferase involved in cellulose biosynthesis
VEITAHDSIAALAAEWDALVDTIGASPFVRPGWLLAWWAAFGTGVAEILVARRDGHLVGVLPMHHLDGVLRTMANDHSPECCFLAADVEVADALAAAMLDRTDRRASLYFLDPTLLGMAALRRKAAASGHRLLVRTAERSPYTTMADDWTAFEARIGGRLRSDLRRRQRRLEERGVLEVELTSVPRDLAATLEEGFAVEASGWKGTHGTGTAISASSATRAFYGDVAAWGLERGWLHLAFLRLDGRALAFELGIRTADEHHRLKAGHDESYRDVAPGKLLLRAVIEDCHAAGVQRFCFGGDAEPYKLEWATGLLERELVQVFASGPRARIEWGALAYGRPVAQRVRGLLRRR